MIKKILSLIIFRTRKRLHIIFFGVVFLFGAIIGISSFYDYLPFKMASAFFENALGRSDYLFVRKNVNEFKASFGDKKDRKKARVKLEVNQEMLELTFKRAKHPLWEMENIVNEGSSVLPTETPKVDDLTPTAAVTEAEILEEETIISPTPSISEAAVTTEPEVGPTFTIAPSPTLPPTNVPTPTSAELESFNFIQKILVRKVLASDEVTPSPSINPTPTISKSYEEWEEFLKEAQDVLSTSSSEVDKIATEVDEIRSDIVDMTGETRIEDIDGEKVILTPNIVTGTDALYKTLANGVKEILLIRKKGRVFSTFVFSLEAENLVFGKTDKKSWLFIEKNGKGNIFEFRNIKAVDGSGEVSENVFINIEKNDDEDDLYDLSVTVDPVWLADPDRQYPIKIEREIVLVDEGEKNKPQLVSEKEVFSSSEMPSFILYYPGIEKSQIEAKLVSDLGQDEKLSIYKIQSGVFRLNIAMPSNFQPGNRTVMARIDDGDDEVFLQQNFLWGVLAINPDKSIYNLNEESNIAMAVLNEKGRMDCDAKLTLYITDPTDNEKVLSTEDETISVSNECNLYQITKLPDYYTKYETSEAGEYFIEIAASTDNGLHMISDHFFVEENPDYEARRVAHTRIFPQLVYPVGIEIKFNKDFEGEIKEVVPIGFKISETFAESESAQIKVAGTPDNEIIWKIKARKEDIVRLSYLYDAPNTSPQFYLVGPLSIGDWQEARKWQIAADAISSLTDRIMVVMVQYETADSLSSIDWSLDTGETFINVTGANASDGSNESQIWYLTGHSEGTGDLIVTYGSRTKGCAGVATFGGVDPSSPIDSSGNSTGSSTSVSVSATVVNSNSWGVGSFRYVSGAVTEGGDQTLLWDNSGAGISGHGSYDATVGTGSQSMTWSIDSSSAYAASVIFLKEKVTGPTTAQQMRHGLWFSGGAEKSFTF